ncbi:myozenin-1 [Spea bombifrons]|uniref:myozenin-1 n=1 Tax=Spea bombifrons TaxID=233779 RepID=UPI0023498B90|nr:myozenin-1 [Spea bombifrons]
MPLSGTPAPNKRKKSTKIIMNINPSREGEQDLSRLNLGKKISVPRDIMLEELSLLSNKGSQMFKLRQKRVEKFIYENNPDVFSDDSVDHFQKFIPSVGGHIGPGGQTGVGGGGYGLGYGSGRMVSSMSGGHYGPGGQHPPVPPPKPGSKGGVGGGQPGDLSSGGKGGSGGIDGTGGKDGQPGQDGPGGKQVAILKTYLSPWDKAMGVDPQEATMLNINLLDYFSKAELCKYKSFNRSAMPYGGYEKASKLMTFQMPEFDAGPTEEPLIVINSAAANRPSFNRTPVGWLGSGESTNYNIEMSVPMDGETEEL